MAIDASIVKELREKTGAGILDCKKALDQSNGDLDKASELLKEKGLAKAAKKDSRSTPEGKVGTYIHSNGKLGVLVEINCETDFVANNDVFTGLLKDLCMQVAATDPASVGREDIPQDIIEDARKGFLEEFKDKPSDIREKIVEGKLENLYKERCLLEQTFIKDNDKTVNDLIKNAIAKLGENIKVNRFTRYKIGL